MADPRAVAAALGEEVDRPIVQADPPRTQEELDASAFQATAGEFRKGVRMGFNQLGAMANAFAGNIGESLGLTEFAATRMKDAEEFVAFGDAVGPRVRDYRQAKDFDSITDFVAGMAGQGAATFVPAIVGGAVGARLGGLRGAFAGLGAGSFVPNAGEQALNIRDLPGSPGAKTANMLGVGAFNAGLDVLGPGGVATRLARPGFRGIRQMGKEVLQTGAVEGVTEGAQELVGQAGMTALAPGRDRSEDTAQAINAALGGAIGGVGLGGAGAVAGVAPGAIADAARGVKKLLPKSREDTMDALGAVLDTTPRVVDETDISPLLENDDIDEAGLIQGMTDLQGKSDSSLERVWKRVGGDKAWAWAKNWKNDPEVRSEFKAAAMKWAKDRTEMPRAKAAAEGVRRFLDRVAEDFSRTLPSASVGRTKPVVRPSLQRTAMDAAILDNLSQYLPEDMDPDEKMEFASAVKHVAMHRYGKRQEVEGPGEPQTQRGFQQDISEQSGPEGLYAHMGLSREDAARPSEGDRGTRLEGIPPEILYRLGKHTVKALNETNEMLTKGGLAQKRDFKKPVQEVAVRYRSRDDMLNQAIHKHLKPKYFTDARTREFVTTGFKRLLTSASAPLIVRRGEAQTGQASFTRAASDLAEAKGEENQRLGPQGSALMNSAEELFVDQKVAMSDLEKLVQDVPLEDSFSLTTEEIMASEPERAVDEPRLAEESRFEDEVAEQVEDEEDGASLTVKEVSEGPYGDARLLVPHDTLERANKELEGIQGYDPKKVRFEVKQTDDGKYMIVAHDAEGIGALTQAEWGRIEENKETHRSGFEHGIITVKTKSHPGGRKVSIRALTGLMMRQVDRKGRGQVEYVADMVMRGLATLLGDPNTIGIGKKTREEIIKGQVVERDTRRRERVPLTGKPVVVSGVKEMRDAFDIPDDTVVAVMGKPERGEERVVYTWGQIKELQAPAGAKEMQLQRVISNSLERAQLADSIADINEKVIPYLDGWVERITKAEVGPAEAKLEFVKEFRAGRARWDEAVEEVLGPQPASIRAMKDLARGLYGDLKWARTRRNRVLTAKENVLEEINRRELTDDVPLGEVGMTNIERLNADMAAGGGATKFTTKVVKEGKIEREERGEAKAGTLRREDRDGPRFTDDTGQALDARGFEMEKVKYGKRVRGAKPVPVPGKKESIGGGELFTGQPASVKLPTTKFSKLVAGLDEKGLKAMKARIRKATDMAALKTSMDGLAQAPASEHQSAVLSAIAERRKVLAEEAEKAKAVKEAEKKGKAAGTKARKWLENKGVKMSAIPADPLKEMTPEQQKEIRGFIEKVLGPKAAVLFDKMAHAGEFANLNGVETLRIALGALDPIGTARHETAHALFLRLMRSDKQAAQALMAAANSPTIISRLRTLLKGHPDAIKQLTAKGQMELDKNLDEPTAQQNAQEERIAYMYQFWAANQLQVGPRTEGWFNKVSRFFKSIVGFWTETFQDMRNTEKAEQIFDLFHRGELANPNTVAEVLREKMPKAGFDRWTEMMPEAWKFFDKAWSTADGIVRGMNIPAFTRIATQMYVPVGKQDSVPGFNQTKHVVINVYINRVNKVLENSTEVEQREAMEILQGGPNIQSGVRARAIAQGMRPILDDLYNYLVKSKVKAVVWNAKDKKYEEHDLEKVPSYFPRYYDKDVIVERRSEFVDMLTRNGMSKAEALEVAENLTRTSKHAPQENDDVAGLTFFAPNTQQRRLDVPAKELAPYLKKDLHGTMASYISFAARRGEYTRRFGNQGQKIEDAVKEATSEGATPDQVRVFNQAVQAWEGSLGHEIDPKLKSLFGAMVTYQNVRLLPLALFSSLVDPQGILVRGGTMSDAFGAYVRGVRSLMADYKDEAWQLAEDVGTISTSVDSHMLADAYGTQYMTGMQRHLNQWFFKWNGMEAWNRAMRVAATAAGERFIIRHATDPNEHSERYMKELNLEPKDVQVQDGRLVLNSRTRAAINQWVDGAVLRPNSSIRPIWMSDPRWMLVSHLKQFAYSFQKTIIARMLHEMENGNYTPAFALASYVPLMLGADLLRAMVTPGGADDDALKRLGLGGLLSRGVQRAGLFGPGEYAMYAWGDLSREKMPLVSLGGPQLQQLYDIGSAVGGKGDLANEIKRAIPGYVLVK
jgi:hypothetical protein